MVAEVHAAGQVVSGGEPPAFEFVVVGGGGEVGKGFGPAVIGNAEGPFDVFEQATVHGGVEGSRGDGWETVEGGGGVGGPAAESPGPGFVRVRHG